MNSSEWVRVTRHQRCPICAKPDYCSVSADGAVCVCMRVQLGAIKTTRNGGFLHRLRETARAHKTCRSFSVSPERLPRPDIGDLASRFEEAITPGQIEVLAESLGVSVASLRRLRTGWHRDENSFAFPMLDVAGRVRGIRLRRCNGSKFAVTGGRDGLFIPTDAERQRSLLICEGPTDTAAAVDLGCNAIGRPSATGGVSLIVEFVRKFHPSDVTIAADVDAAGQLGAKTLAKTLLLHVPQIRVWTPPPETKDLRSWRRAGATSRDFSAAIKRTPFLEISLSKVSLI